MFTKATFRYRFRRTGGNEAAKQQSFQPRNDVHERGIYVGTDPDAKVRFELHRNADRGK